MPNVPSLKLSRTRKAYAEALHTALKEKKIPREALPAYITRSLSLILGPAFAKEFGLKKLPADKEAEIAKYKTLATPAALARADVSSGRKTLPNNLLRLPRHVWRGRKNRP